VTDAKLTASCLEGLLKERRPPLTAFAIHPAAHFFAAGYADGSIAFWAVEDDDRPILVRTIDEVNVNVVDGDKLEQHLPQTKSQAQIPSVTEREPIFKLAWSGFPNSSDPRGGETALSVLGGLIPGVDSGVVVFWFPPFNPPELPAPTGPEAGLHPFMKDEMHKSLMPSKSWTYLTLGLTQDFLLIPRNNPHLSGSFDPIAILLLSEAEGNTRAVDAYQFPPPDFLDSATSPTRGEPDVGEQSSDAFAEDLTASLKSMQLSPEPQKLRLPTSLWSGGSSVFDAQVVQLGPDAYNSLDVNAPQGDGAFPSRGGIAHLDDTNAKAMKLFKVHCVMPFRYDSVLKIVYSTNLTE
jgi:syntaxin-binding protein 5